MSVGIVGAGAMGSALAARITAAGGVVRTPLDGRSARSCERARAAGMLDTPLSALGDCDLILSVVPPEAAFQVASELAPVLGQGRPRLAFIDCNAVAPQTSIAIAELITSAGAAFVDGAIMMGASGPVLYASGTDAELARALEPYGVPVRVLAAPIGAASSLKMALAVLSKGVTGLLCLAATEASRAGVLEAFLDQAAVSQPGVLAWGRSQLPSLGAKAGRWVQEMRILQEAPAQLPGGPEVFAGLEILFASLANEDAYPPELRELAARLTGDQRQAAP